MGVQVAQEATLRPDILPWEPGAAEHAGTEDLAAMEGMDRNAVDVNDDASCKSSEESFDGTSDELSERLKRGEQLWQSYLDFINRQTSDTTTEWDLFNDQLQLWLESFNDLCFWPMSLDLCERHSNWLTACPDRLSLAAEAAWQMGYLQLAQDWLRAALLLAPHSPELTSQYHSLQDWVGFCRQFPVGLNNPRDDNHLHLQLLGHQHMRSYLNVYDEQVVDLCCLPDYADASDWHHWLDQQYAEGDQLSFAVMHEHWGMVGVVSLVMHRQVGFFYYWIGADYRGQGLGPQAVNLLLQSAVQTWGLHTCYAKVYDYNGGSRRALEKLGFEELPIRATEPNERELFYRLGESADADIITSEMYWFYERMGCYKAFTRPLPGALFFFPGQGGWH